MTYQSPPGGIPSTVPNSSMAVVSLVAGILGITFLPLIGSIVAVITGYMARKEIQQSNGDLGGDGLATAGLVLGWVGIALSVIGVCIFGVLFAVPFCLVLLGISTSNSSSMLPALLAALVTI
jgi:hypothetical protein